MAAREGQSQVAAEARRLDWDRFMCALFAPESQRDALFALIAVHAEIVRAPEVVREPLMAEIRRQWWRDAVAAIYEGGSPPVTPVVGALGRATVDFNLPRQELDDLIDEPSAALLMQLQLRVLANGKEPDGSASEAGTLIVRNELAAARAIRHRVPRHFHPALLWATMLENRDASRFWRQLRLGWAAFRGRF